MQLIQVEFLPLSQMSCSQGRIQNQDPTPKNGTAEVFRVLHSTVLFMQAPCSHKAHSLPPQIAKKGMGDHLLTLLLGHWRLKTENQQGQEKQIGKMETNSLTYGERDLQALFSASGKCICLFFFSENIQRNFIFSRKMEANSKTSENWPYVQPVVVGQPWDMFLGGERTMLELQHDAGPSPIPQTRQVSASSSSQNHAP